jgi:transcriptional regulator with XRE-family HTH domain
VTTSRNGIPEPYSFEVHADLGIKLKLFIKQKYGTAKKFARLMNVSEAQISMILAGKRIIPLALKEKLLRDGFPEADIYNYIITDNLKDISSDAREIIFQLKRIIDYQNNLMVTYEKAIIELRKDYDNLRKINKNVNSY